MHFILELAFKKVISILSKVISILSSDGIEFFVDVEGLTPSGIEPQGFYPRVEDEDITWIFQIYRFRFASDADGFDDDLFRYTVKAVRNDFELRFPGVSSTTDIGVNLHLAVRFSRGGMNDTLANFLTPTGLLISGTENISIPVNSSNIPTDISANASKIQDGFSSYLGLLGTQVSSLVTNGFLAGSENSSVVTGPLIQLTGDDREIQPLVGINWPLFNIGESVSGGLTVGGTVTENAALFVGPSFNIDVVSFGVGASIFGEQDTIRTEAAGFLSFDLSRLVGGRRPTTQSLTFESNEEGGNWGEATSELTKNLGLIAWSLTSELTGTVGLEIVRIVRTQSNGIEKIEEKETYPLNPGDNMIGFVNLEGDVTEYRYVVPRGYVLVAEDGGIVEVPADHIAITDNSDESDQMRIVSHWIPKSDGTGCMPERQGFKLGNENVSAEQRKLESVELYRINRNQPIYLRELKKVNNNEYFMINNRRFYVVPYGNDTRFTFKPVSGTEEKGCFLTVGNSDVS
jgi:hypothetical protein